MARILQSVLALLVATGLGATTLERLTVDQMVEKSTSIVRGKVLSAAPVQRGSLIYTVYRVQVAEWIKGVSTTSTTEVYVPGGVINGRRQSIAGAPALEVGGEYVVFVWVSPSGTPYIIGLSQGVLSVRMSATTAEAVLLRGPIEDAQVVDANGQPSTDSGLKLSLSNLRLRARQAVTR
ncbi:hypothetical protein [Paludibaculum fermentans]|uniref:Uncharacterized protein n=1 Tax=Paludibaculum fermentans TaxID=1473598 RepID=A0A7S7SKR8_PALFE|nr:hypothetical protein [Paludibaculum fermentans]QOY89452.1 hypothetical protein IRI77_05730 [Paludibaculum fermentans]